MTAPEIIEAKRRRCMPAATRKVTLKTAAACAYLYETAGRPYALAFYGAQTKPAWHFRFRSEEERSARIAKHFDSALATAAFRAQRASERAARESVGRKLQVGHILRTSWGYDQTNIDFFEVTALVGTRMVELRKIASNTVETTGWATGTSVPIAGQFVGEPFRCVVRGAFNVRIDGHFAAVWDGTPQRWSAYA